MEILMVAAEVAPYVVATDAAEAVASLGKALRQLGHNVTVLAPRQPGFESHGLLLARRLTPLLLPDGGEVHVLDAQLPSGVQLTLFDAPVLFDRPGVYGEAGGDYPDNPRRFSLLAQAAAALVRQREQQGNAFDLVHLHDAAAALVPVALGRAPGPSVPTVLTIHDVRQQGSYATEQADELARALGTDSDELFTLDGRINLLKVGISTADTVTTVSTSYAAELPDEACSGPLARVIRDSGKEPIGIVNGVDYAVFNPATDGALPSRYDAEDPAHKSICKGQVLRSLELTGDLDRPLIVVPVVDGPSSGSELVVAALPSLLKREASLVLTGSLPTALARKVKALRQRHREELAWVESPEAVLARRLLAAADFAIAAASHVPCGTIPLVAERYGAVPIARAAGGHRDTVVDCDAALDTGTGFLFDEESVDALVAAVARALAAHTSRSFSRLRRRVMRLDVGWDRPARRYLQVYRHTLAARG